MVSNHGTVVWSGYDDDVAGEVGADISYFQSFNAAAYSYPFIFIRATFGVTMIDPAFAGFRAQARAKGIPNRAYYHFLVANASAQAQFNLFAGQVGDLTPGENVMIDDEAYGPTGGLPSRAMVQQFAQFCHDRWGIWPIHYSLASVGRIDGCPQTNASYSSWNPGGDFWQYSDGVYNYTGLPRSAGGIGNCDMNLCNGTLANCFLGGAAAQEEDLQPDERAALFELHDAVIGAVAQGQTSFADTIRATLGSVQGLYNFDLQAVAGELAKIEESIANISTSAPAAGGGGLTAAQDQEIKNISATVDSVKASLNAAADAVESVKAAAAGGTS